MLHLLQPFVAAAAAASSAHAAGGSAAPDLSCCLPLLAFDEGLLRHAPPADSSHPERPERAAAVMARLVATGLAARCRRVSLGGLCVYIIARWQHAAGGCGDGSAVELADLASGSMLVAVCSAAGMWRGAACVVAWLKPVCR
jgi:hypothetical protein